MSAAKKKFDALKKFNVAKSSLKRIISGIVPLWAQQLFFKFDQKVDGGLSFFFSHFGKTKFMVAMSKKIQVWGPEKLWEQGPKAFVYFFLFYLIRDTILYIIIPIFFAQATSS